MLVSFIVPYTASIPSKLPFHVCSQRSDSTTQETHNIVLLFFLVQAKGRKTPTATPAHRSVPTTPPATTLASPGWTPTCPLSPPSTPTPGASTSAPPPPPLAPAPPTPGSPSPPPATPLGMLCVRTHLCVSHDAAIPSWISALVSVGNYADRTARSRSAMPRLTITGRRGNSRSRRAPRAAHIVRRSSMLMHGVSNGPNNG